MNNKITVIAEAGVNHNGKLSQALKMIDVASKAKADFIKFQTFDPKSVTTKNLGLAKYQKKGSSDKTHFKLLDKLKLSKDDFVKIIKRCKKKKIKFLSSPFDINSIKLLKKLRIKTFKIPSGEINNVPYLEYIGSLKRNIILSTGMSDLVEVKNAINILVRNGMKKKNISILHCSTEYPANIKKLNLMSIRYLKDKLKLNVGYSDHSIGYEASLISLALGAKIFEKHFTLNKFAKGPDHKASLSPKELINYIKKLNDFKKSIGRYQKKPYKEELRIAKIARKQIVALSKIKPGDKFSVKNITTKRARQGIPASQWNKILGKYSKFYFTEDQNIKV